MAALVRPLTASEWIEPALVPPACALRDDMVFALAELIGHPRDAVASVRDAFASVGGDFEEPTLVDIDLALDVVAALAMQSGASASRALDTFDRIRARAQAALH